MSSIRYLPLALALGGHLAACAPVPVGSGPQPVRGARTITAEQIRRSGANTAWQALERMPGPLQLGVRPDGEVTARSTRGLTSDVYSPEPLLVVDGVRMTDLGVLRHLPAENVRSIEVLSGIEGSVLHGTGSSNGVIVVRTAPPGTF